MFYQCKYYLFHLMQSIPFSFIFCQKFNQTINKNKILCFLFCTKSCLLYSPALYNFSVVQRDYMPLNYCDLIMNIQGLSERMIIMISLAYIYFLIKKGYDYDFLDQNCSCFNFLLLVCFQLHQNFSQAPGAAHSPAGLGALPEVCFFGFYFVLIC